MALEVSLHSSAALEGKAHIARASDRPTNLTKQWLKAIDNTVECPAFHEATQTAQGAKLDLRLAAESTNEKPCL